LGKDEAKDAIKLDSGCYLTENGIKTGSGCYLSEQDVIILMKRYGTQTGILHVAPGHNIKSEIMEAMASSKGQIIVIGSNDTVMAAEHTLPVRPPIIDFPIVACDSVRDIADGQTKRRDRRAKQRKNKR
jgi:hypothetical protein